VYFSLRVHLLIEIIDRGEKFTSPNILIKCLYIFFVLLLFLTVKFLLYLLAVVTIIALPSFIISKVTSSQ